MGKQGFLLIVLSLVLLMTGCSMAGLGQGENGALSPASSKDLMSSFNRFEENKDLEKMLEFIEKNNMLLRSEELTRALTAFRNLQKENLGQLNEGIDNPLIQIKLRELGLEKLEDREEIGARIKSLEDGDLKDRLERAYGLNYRLMEGDGGYVFVIDYSSYKDYEANLSSEFKELIGIYRKEQELSLGKLELLDLGQKLKEIEDHLAEYRQALDYEDLLRIYSDNLIVALKGNENIDIFDRENKIIDRALLSYKDMAEIKGIGGRAIGQYLLELDKKQGIYGEDLEASIVTIHNKAIALLEK